MLAHINRDLGGTLGVLVVAEVLCNISLLLTKKLSCFPTLHIDGCPMPLISTLVPGYQME